MKKILAIVSVLLFSFALGACDLIPEEIIDGVKDDVCIDDPTNPLCEVEDLDDLIDLLDLEDQVVLDLVNELLTHHNSGDLESYCESYFSMSNTDLMDACKLEENSLFPEGIEEFEVLSIEIVDNEYQIELQHKMYAEKIMISLELGLENEDIFIKNMRIGPIYVLEPSIELASVLDLIDQFVLDLGDETKSNSEVCTTWYNEDDDCDGHIEDVRRKFKAGSDLSKKVYILDDDDDGDGVPTAAVSFTLDGHVTVLKINFDPDTSGEDLTLKITWTWVDASVDSISDEELTKKVLTFIADLEDNTKTDKEVCSTWFNEDDDCDGVIEDIRTRFKAGSDLSKKVNVVDEDSDDDTVFDAIVSFDHNGHVTVLKIKIDVNGTEIAIKESIVEFKPDPIVDAQLKTLLDDLSNPDLSLEELCERWSDGVDDDCNGIVAIDPVIKYKFVLKTIMPFGDDPDNLGSEATFESKVDGHVTVLKIAFTEEDTTDGKKLSDFEVSLSDRVTDQTGDTDIDDDGLSD